MRARLAILVIVLFALPGMPVGATSHPEDCADAVDDVGDPSPPSALPPNVAASRSEIDIRSVCIQETHDLVMVRIVTAAQPIATSGEALRFEVAFELQGAPFSCVFTMTATGSESTGCPGSKVGPTTYLGYFGLVWNLTRGASGFETGAALTNLFASSSGSYTTAISTETAADRSPDQGTIFAVDAPYRVAIRAPYTLNSDLDLVPDRNELLLGSDPFSPDTDRDGLLDADASESDRPVKRESAEHALLLAAGIAIVDTNETHVWFGSEGRGNSDVLNPDSDADGLIDGVTRRLSPQDVAVYERANARPLFQPGTTDIALGEHSFGARPSRADSDGDGLTDAEEILGTLNPYKEHASFAGFAGSTRPGSRDSDGDELDDDEELRGRAVLLGRETEFRPSDPNRADTDADGLADVDELVGQMVPRGREPVDFTPTDPSRADTDGDGHHDLAEALAGTDPRDGSDKPGTMRKLVASAVAVVVLGVGAMIFVIVRRQS